MAEVDIIIPLYNKADYVCRAIDSILRQTVRDWHLIVVDDGSSDNGPDIVRNIKDSRIDLIQQSNQGPGAARNAGIARANSNYLAFLDADDEWCPCYLANALAAIKENDVALVSSMYYTWPSQKDMTQFWANRNVLAKKYELQGSESPRWAARLTPFMSPWNTVIRRDIAVKYDGFYGRDHCMRAEDETFFMRIAFGERFMFIGPPAVRYHTESSTIGHIPKPHPLEPFLADPQVLLGYCPEHKKNLLHQVLSYRALGTARHWARYGLKTQAQQLLERFPGARAYRARYYRCRCEIILSRWLPLWLKLKWAIGPRTRQFLRRLGQKLSLISAAPDILQSQNTHGPDKRKTK
jgi:glycosyltransferase involved in cell wall biosynthesis